MPHADWVAIKTTPPVCKKAVKQSFASNSHKLQIWIDQLKKSDQPTLLADCDMLMTRPLDDVWEREFDIAYTEREEGLKAKCGPVYVIEGGRKVRKGPKPHPGLPDGWGLNRKGPDRKRLWPPYNGGVMFVRPNERSIKFMETQLAVNNRMLHDEKFHMPWRAVYCGINQAAFGFMIEKHPDICKLLSLPCSEWNACDATWMHYDDKVRMVHIKSALRWQCVGKNKIDPNLKHVVGMWREYEKMGVGG